MDRHAVLEVGQVEVQTRARLELVITVPLALAASEGSLASPRSARGH
jgi:hypothetical protein